MEIQQIHGKSHGNPTEMSWNSPVCTPQHGGASPRLSLGAHHEGGHARGSDLHGLLVSQLLRPLDATYRDG